MLNGSVNNVWLVVPLFNKSKDFYVCHATTLRMVQIVQMLVLMELIYIRHSYIILELENVNLALKFLIVAYVTTMVELFVTHVMNQTPIISILINLIQHILMLFACNVINLISIKTLDPVLYVPRNSMHLIKMEMFANLVSSTDVLCAILKLEPIQRGLYSVSHAVITFQVHLPIY